MPRHAPPLEQLRSACRLEIPQHDAELGDEIVGVAKVPLRIERHVAAQNPKNP